MSVYESRYRKIKEDIKQITTLNAAMSMSVFEIRRGLSGSWPKVVLILAGFIIFGFLVQLNSFLLTPAKEFWLGETMDGSESSPFSVQGSISFLLTPMDGPGVIMIIHISVVSAGLIAGDLKDRAIDLYLSKININEYFLSKVVASMALTFIGLPMFSIIYFIIATYKRWPELSEYPLMGEVLIRLLAVVAIEVIFLSVIILAFSAFTTNPVNSGVVFLVFIFVSREFFEHILFQATNLDIFYVLSPISTLDVIRRSLLAPDEISDQFLGLAIPVGLFYILLSLFLVYWKIRKEQNN